MAPESDNHGLSDVEARLEQIWQSGKIPANQIVVSGQIIGQYKIRAYLGAGSFGLVYLADDIETKRPVALKLPRLEVL